METTRWNLKNNNDRYNRAAIAEAAALLTSGSTVAFPTETVYGLGADATSEAAVSNIFQAKGRPQDNPLIAHVANKEQLTRIVEKLPAFVDNLIDAFAPGPLTFVLPSNGVCASNVTAGLSTIAVRMPDHPVAQQLLQICDIPIAAPSANISGKPSPTTAAHVWADLNGKVSGLLDGGATGVGVESTVIDCTKEIPIILRPGGITKEQLEKVVGTIMIDPALVNANEQPTSPGMKYKHYSPDIPLWLVEGTPANLQQVIDGERKKNCRIGVLSSTKTGALLEADEIISLGEDSHEIAANLYEGLRTFKEGDVDIILCETFSEEGIGEAIMNRLKKAATVYKRDSLT
ncbi:L-threonylcarbamoyladenylate synthase [Virgibacillus natechei]|uniref:Threonylcarbamoyl-AMP synthase n=1 Tax=Virgibacillus natechei TaxID=1216297 RepID=A0ABS4IFY4_9BACI|nr:L-threonylcarbamoyladenylate synthase [Virgibacillus natechei]MBP1969862.1 L-threonylcarbamoyladenylate synthase [Virgibacillus natechei]UZD12608.1 L-threonylcarbamoyladenylate synthase [Virgibacillus natechei]